MSIEQKNILIDFDHTLFNTDDFRKLHDANVNADTDFRKLLYPDALNFISYASKYGEPLLFSEGPVNFQEEKIRKTGLKQLFKERVDVYPVDEKIKRIKNSSNKGNIVLIDDNPKITDEATREGVFVIRVRRGKYKSIDDKIDPTYTVESLEEIVDKDLLNKIEI